MKKRFTSRRSVLKYAREQWMLHVAPKFDPDDPDNEGVEDWYLRLRDPEIWVTIAKPGEMDENTTAGMYYAGSITLSSRLHLFRDELTVDTVAHEIAHLLAEYIDEELEHGECWKCWAEKLGCTNFRMYEEEKHA
jgi:hypothetical protein